MASYRRFIILSEPRTGSSMLVQALNSSPQIVCFREVFNGRLDFIDFSMEGYDNFSSADRPLRKQDPVRFLHERIFCSWPDDIRAVGFKLLYEHYIDFPGLIEGLVRDAGLHVIDLRRRNVLRMLVSFKLAEETGVWMQEQPAKLTRSRLFAAIRHPQRAISRAPQVLRRRRPQPEQRPRMRITAHEFFEFAMKSHLRGEGYDEMFQDHPRFPVSYEDMTERQDAVFAAVQSFLGVEPRPLQVTLERQNPQPLRELIENYDELRETFQNTPAAEFFD
jgi:hypothetical protein